MIHKVIKGYEMKTVPRNLSIFVNEHERVRDIVVAHVHYGRTNPIAKASLHGAHNR